MHTAKGSRKAERGEYILGQGWRMLKRQLLLVIKSTASRKTAIRPNKLDRFVEKRKIVDNE